MTQTLDAPTEALEEEDFTLTEDLGAVLVWNDDVTTFQTVIQAFVETGQQSGFHASG